MWNIEVHTHNREVYNSKIELPRHYLEYDDDDEEHDT